MALIRLVRGGLGLEGFSSISSVILLVRRRMWTAKKFMRRSWWAGRVRKGNSVGRKGFVVM